MAIFLSKLIYLIHLKLLRVYCLWISLTWKISVLYTNKKRSQRFQKEWSLVIVYKKINKCKNQVKQNGYKDELLPLEIRVWDPWKIHLLKPQISIYSVLNTHPLFPLDKFYLLHQRILELRYPDKLLIEWLFHLKVLEEERVTWQMSKGNLHRPKSLNSESRRKSPDLFVKLQPWMTGFPGGSDGKASACNVWDPGLILGSGRSPGEGNGNPLQYSCLENPMDRGAW